MLAMLAAAAMLCGCVQYRVVSNGWSDLEDLARESGGTVGGGEAGQQARAAMERQLVGYTIELERFTGEKRSKRAARTIKLVQGELGYDGAWVLDQGGVARVVLGRFTSPVDAMAQAMLEDVRAIKVDGEPAFARADIVPLADGPRGEQNPLNAANHVGFFTLQIGFYDDQFDGDRREAAETAVRVLRDEGEEAYFYHGPNMSLVCVGLFTQHDFVRKGNEKAGIDTYGPRIQEVQDRFPHNLANGRTLDETINGQSLGAQPSCLVRIF